MKFNINRKKLRYGGVAIALTAFIIAAVVLLNVLFYSLAANFRWYIDMTSEAIFTLSDECRDLINNAITGEGGVNDQRHEYNTKNNLVPGDPDYKEDAEVTIYFCDDPDNLKENTYMNYVYTTALDLADACRFIKIEYLNWEYNPTSVQRFRATGVNINSTSIIVESGTEYRVFTLQAMFIQNDDGTVWAYNGEKRLAGAILAVTSVDQPIAYITTSHSEAFYDTALLELLIDAGYKIEIEGDDGNTLSGKTNPLDNEDVRLLVVYNPRSDFGTEGINELDRINRFLENNNSMMVFMGPDSPVLPDFEEWLATWGAKFDRTKDADGRLYSHVVKDDTASLDSAGYKVKANYVTTGGLGYSIYENMIKNGITPSVYFEKAMPISFASQYTLTTYSDEEADDRSGDFKYGHYYSGGVSKDIFDVFTAPSSAVAIANGSKVADGGTVNPSGSITYIFTDLDGKVYTSKVTETEDSDGNKTLEKAILDPDGKPLPYGADGKFVTAAGTALTVADDGTIKSDLEKADNVGIVTSIYEYDGSSYTLSADGKSILDAAGNALEADENGQYVTAAGSVLEIENVSGAASIKIVSGAQTTVNPFKFMTITQRTNSVQETNYLSTSQDAYVLVCGSLEFATEKYLKSAVYGNSDVLLSATTVMGRDVVPVGLDFKPFASFDISDITDAEANRYTVLLSVLPAVVVIVAAVVVLVRRKNS